MKTNTATLEEIRNRWKKGKKLPEMVFSSHVQQDMEVLFKRIKDLEDDLLFCEDLLLDGRRIC